MAHFFHGEFYLHERTVGPWRQLVQVFTCHSPLKIHFTEVSDMMSPDIERYLGVGKHN